MNQSKIIAGGINQQPMEAVTIAIANRIKINVQSIFKQYKKRQQPINATFININALSVNINAQSINNQCALHQQPMPIASDFLMLGFSSPNTFTLCSMPSTSVILSGAEGEVAESILLESTLSQGVWDDHLQSPFSLEGEGFPSLFRNSVFCNSG